MAKRAVQTKPRAAWGAAKPLQPMACNIISEILHETLLVYDALTGIATETARWHGLAHEKRDRITRRVDYLLSEPRATAAHLHNWINSTLGGGLPPYEEMDPVRKRRAILTVAIVRALS